MKTPSVGRVYGKRSKAGEGTRTLDIQLGKLALYQLSYVRLMQSYSPSDGLPQQLGFGGENAL